MPTTSKMRPTDSPVGSNPFLTDGDGESEAESQANRTAYEPIFEHRLEIYKPPRQIVRMLSAGRLLVLLLEGNLLLRIDHNNKNSKQESSEIELQCDKHIEDIFIDPLGRHLLLRQRGGETFYLNRTGKKLRNVAKLKNHRLTCVAWNYFQHHEQTTTYDKSASSSTGSILLGTESGAIFETSLQVAAPADTGSLKDLYWTHVVSMDAQIKGMCVGKLDNVPDRYFVLVATSTQLYQFVGQISNSSQQRNSPSSTLPPSSTLSSSSSSPDEPILTPLFVFDDQRGIPKHVEFPGVPKRSELQAYRHEMFSCPSVCSWLATDIIYIAQIDNPPPNTTPNSVNTVLHQKQHHKLTKNGEMPVGIIVTQFHVIALFKRTARIISALTGKVVQEDPFSMDDSSGDGMLGICRDEQSNIVFAYSRNNIYRYRVRNEARDVWPIYLKLEDFTRAEQYAATTTNNPRENVDFVLTRKAHDQFQRRDYSNSALTFARTQASFEEVALRFLAIGGDGEGGQQALKIYLREKLEQLRPSEKYSTQIFLIVSWLAEIYLNEVSKLRISISSSSSLSAVPSSTSHEVVNVSAAAARAENEAKTLKNNFVALISSPHILPCLRDYAENRNAFYSIAAAHGASEDIIAFAFAAQDYEKIVDLYMQAGKFHDALLVLSKLNSNSGSFETFHVDEMFYRYSAQLMQHLPQETVLEWKNAGKKLNVAQLLPALVQSTGIDFSTATTTTTAAAAPPTYDYEVLVAETDNRKSSQSQSSKNAEKRKLILDMACTYLEYCMQNFRSICTDEAVHNFLLTLFCLRHDEDGLFKYFDAVADDMAVDMPSSVRRRPHPTTNVNDVADNDDDPTKNLPFDFNYILRLCLDYKLHRAVCKLYELIELYDDAVHVALELVGDDAGVQLAKDLAKNSATTSSKKISHGDEKDNEQQRKLWLKIAQHVITNRPHDVSAAMKLLDEAGNSNLIRIEDILPFFPAFDTIDEFKSAICASLEQYNRHIVKLKKEMDDATQSAKNIRDDISAFRDKHTTVNAKDGCEKCGAQVLGRKFYIFPACMHFFHAECLATHVEPLLSRDKFAELKSLRRKEEQQMLVGGGKATNFIASDDSSAANVSISAAVSQRDQVLSSIDDILAADCPLCGDYAVQVIDRPFFALDEYEMVLKRWQ